MFKSKFKPTGKPELDNAIRLLGRELERIELLREAKYCAEKATEYFRRAMFCFEKGNHASFMWYSNISDQWRIKAEKMAEKAEGI